LIYEGNSLLSGLIIATLTVNSQINLIKKGGESYQGLIEVGNWMGDGNYMESFMQDLRARPEIGTVIGMGGSMLNSWLMQIIIRNEDGSETYYPLTTFEADKDIFETFDFKVLQGFQPDEAVNQFTRPAYVNEAFARLLVADGDNPIGKTIERLS